jgi:hypothetical protein
MVRVEHAVYATSRRRLQRENSAGVSQSVFANAGKTSMMRQFHRAGLLRRR